MRDENRRVAGQLAAERARVERLAHVTKGLYDMVAKVMPPGQSACSLPPRPADADAVHPVPMPFPADLMEPDFMGSTSYSPHHSQQHSHAQHYPPPSLPVLNNPALHTMHPISPNASPTSQDFSPQQQQQQHYYAPPQHEHQNGHTLARHHSFAHLASAYDAGERPDAPKRQRRSPEMAPNGKTLSRARSDSAPLGYALGRRSDVDAAGIVLPTLAPRPP